jgi:signal peptidase I
MEELWKPKKWIAVLLGVLLQSFTFLYLNNLKLFWVYFVSIILVTVFDYYVGGVYALIFSVICPLHAYFIVDKSNIGKKRAWYSMWWGIPTVYLVILAPVLLVRTFLFEPFLIPAVSMEPTLEIGDYILVKKFGFNSLTLVSDSSKPDEDSMERGKLYVYYPPGEDMLYVKRLIAKPGDSLALSGYQVVLNNNPLTTKLVNDDSAAQIYEEQINGRKYLVKRMLRRQQSIPAISEIPKGNYFFMGDNRDNSRDSRFTGLIPEENIIGEVVYIFD